MKTLPGPPTPTLPAASQRPLPPLSLALQSLSLVILLSLPLPASPPHPSGGGEAQNLTQETLKIKWFATVFRLALFSWRLCDVRLSWSVKINM